MKLALEIINREIAQRELANKQKHLRFDICAKEIKELYEVKSLINGVTGSIGRDTKPVLMELTDEQKKITDDICSICRYKESGMNSPECNKCFMENSSDQYYL